MAAGPSYFPLMESNQRSRQKKASARPAGSYAFSVLRTLQRLNRHSRHTPGPLFCQPCALLLPDSLVIPFSRQQNSFGRNQAKLWWPKARGKGISKLLLKRWLCGNGAKVLQPVVLPDLQSMARCAKKPNLLSARWRMVTFVATKVTKSSRGN